MLIAPEGRAEEPMPVRPVVEIEEDVYRFKPSDNGSGPLWCHGSTCLVRVGNDCFASGIETIPELKPLNNCRWLLFRRGVDGWKQVQADPDGADARAKPARRFSRWDVSFSRQIQLWLPGTPLAVVPPGLKSCNSRRLNLGTLSSGSCQAGRERPLLPSILTEVSPPTVPTGSSFCFKTLITPMRNGPSAIVTVNGKPKGSCVGPGVPSTRSRSQFGSVIPPLH